MSLPRQMGYRREKESRNRMDASQYQQYLEAKVVEGMEIYCEGTSKEWVEEFSYQATLYGKKNNNIAIEYVESWSAEESEQIGFGRLYEMGVENAKKAFPGHAFVVVPHVNKNGNFHTHVLFCPVSETGERMYSNFKERTIWNRVTDENSIKNGLSTVRKNQSYQPERLSRSAYQMLRRGKGIPHQLEVMQKADFARRIAISIEDFTHIMAGLDIQVEKRGKTLAYFHNDRARPIRGRAIGTNYQKRGLEKCFYLNVKEQKSRPRLRQGLIEKMEDWRSRGGTLTTQTDFLFYPGGHKKIMKMAISKGKEKSMPIRNVLSPEHDELTPFSILRGALREVNTRSIPEYCEKHGIALVPQKDGSFRLKGREHILIKGTKWENTKMRYGKPIGTCGTLLEFVANHRDCTFTQSMAYITGNTNLLLVEQYLGKMERTFKEFTIPAQNKCDKNQSPLEKLALSLGYKSEVGRWIQRSQKVQKHTENLIRFVMGVNDEGRIDFVPNQKGDWRMILSGSTRHGFDKQHGTSSKLHVFKDPFAFYQHTGGRGMMKFRHSDNVLVLAWDNHEAVDIFVAENQNIKNISFIGLEPKDVNSERSKMLKKHGIEFNFMQLNRGKEKSRGIELSL